MLTKQPALHLHMGPVEQNSEREFEFSQDVMSREFRNREKLLAATRLVTSNRKYDHIMPVLQALHWLPVRYRLNSF